MVSKEPNILPSVHSHSNGNPDKTASAVTVRSVLLNRNSPDIESRLKRRRNRTQQVRFKDLEDDEDKNDKVKSPTEIPNWQKELTNGPSLVGSVRGDMEKTIGAVTAFLKRAPPHPLTPGPTRRCWVPTHPCSFTLPLPSQPCRSTAIQTSPSLQKPPSLSATQTRSHSLVDGVRGSWDDGDSSDELTAQVYFTSQQSPGQQDSPAEQSRCQKTEDNQSATQRQPCSSAPHKQSRRRGRRKPLNRAASDPGKPEPSVPADGRDQQSTQSKKKAVSQRSPTPNILHNVSCNVSSTQTEPNCDSKMQTFSDSSVPRENTSHTAAPPVHASQTCPKETQNVPSQCFPPQALKQTEHSSLTPALSDSIQVTPSSPHGPSRTSHNETSGRCGTPAIQTMTNCKTPELHAEPITPHKFIPGCQTLEESLNNAGQKATSCSLGASAVASTSHPRQKTPTQLMTCNNTSIQPVPSVTCPTQSVTPIQSVPNCKASSSLPVSHCFPDTQTVQTTTLTTHTPTANQSTIQPVQPIQSVAPMSCPTEPVLSHKAPTPFPPGPPRATTYTVSHLKSSIPAVTHIIPIAQPAAHCILGPQNMGAHVTPSLPVLICSPSAVQTLPYCNASVQNPPQIIQNLKTPMQAVPHSKSFPQNTPPGEAVTYTGVPQNTVLPNFRHSLPPYACPPQTALLYSNTGVNPSPPQAFCSTQDRRDRREFMLPPPPPPPPPPYTPRKEGSSTPGRPRKPPAPKADSNNTEKEKAKTAKPNAEARSNDTPPPIPPKSKARAMVKPTCLGTRRAILGPESHLPPVAGTIPRAPLGSVEGQADTLRQVQDLLGGLMSGAKCKLDLAKAKEKLFGPNGPLYDIGTLQSQLHSLEGVLETSQNTIKVLLDVIQDLEKKEAERDGIRR